ncbi:MAG: insulinase family protein [Sulfobacillus acidophilus]|uniref:Insulinase family protein n=1 Tax=Sulfobacillus acidophilus TaxID=53633 RepID=A0A2T2WGE8_9FIRM|nr:MAG: insulinase family protein [Sulfobacillus acidophilus]
MAWSNAQDRFVGEWKDGVAFYVYPTRRFKTVTIHATWIRDLSTVDRSKGATLAQVMRQGTRSWPTRQLMAARLEDLYGASFRADIAKLGDKQLLSFHITVTNGRFLPGQPDTVREALDFLTQVLDRPYLVDGVFPRTVVEQEKTLVKRQIAAIINDKGQYAMSRLIELVADGQPFGLRKLGTEQEVDQITERDLTTFYQEVHRGAPFVFTVVGDVDADVLYQHVKERWGTSRQEFSAVVPYQGRHQNQTVVEAQDVRQGKLNLAYRTGRTAKSADFPALVMYSGILGGFSHSKLFINVREKASLAYYAYSRVDPALGLLMIGAGIEFNDYQACRSIIEDQVAAMRRGDFTDDELAFTLKAYENDILSEEDSPGQLIGRHLEYLLVGGGHQGPDLIAALAQVTRDDVVNVAQAIDLDTVYFLTSKEVHES